MTPKQWLGIQSLALFGGTVFAWSKLIPQFTDFYALYGTFFRVSDCVIPNPFTTACLYGSLAFLVALYWSVRLYQDPSHKSERRLRGFLIFCVVFAGSVVLFETAQYLKFFPSTVSVSCTPGASPLTTPCFTGMLFFICAFTASVVATRRLASDTVSE